MNYLSVFFDSLRLSNIKYCVLRNYQSLPKSKGGSDLDILVHKKDEIKFLYLMESFIKTNKLKLVSVINDKQCPKYCISNIYWGIQIDVFKGSVYFGKRELIPSSILFENTQDYQGVSVLNPKVGAILSFLKELLNNKNCNKKYILELQNQHCAKGIDARLLSQFTSQFLDYLNLNLHQLDKKHCLKLYQLSKRGFKRSKFYGFNNKIKRLLKQPGFTIAFLGTDGSGKSTIVENIRPTLNNAFHKAVYYEHMRPKKFLSIARLLGKKERFSGPVTNPHGSEPSGLVGSFVRWFYYMLDYTLGYYLKIYPKKAIRCCVWIFDRYYYDYLIDPKRGRIDLPQWILKLGQFIIPEPDLILCLGTHAEIIHNRKPELPLKEVERQVAELKRFCNSHKRAVWIDTTNSIETSSDDAMAAIIKVMAKRFDSIKLNE